MLITIISPLVEFPVVSTTSSTSYSEVVSNEFTSPAVRTTNRNILGQVFAFGGVGGTGEMETGE